MQCCLQRSDQKINFMPNSKRRRPMPSVMMLPANVSPPLLLKFVFWKLPRVTSSRIGSGTPRNCTFMTLKAWAWNCAFSRSVIAMSLKNARFAVLMCCPRRVLRPHAGKRCAVDDRGCRCVLNPVHRTRGCRRPVTKSNRLHVEAVVPVQVYWPTVLAVPRSSQRSDGRHRRFPRNFPPDRTDFRSHIAEWWCRAARCCSDTWYSPAIRRAHGPAGHAVTYRTASCKRRPHRPHAGKSIPELARSAPLVLNGFCA